MAYFVLVELSSAHMSIDMKTEWNPTAVLPICYVSEYVIFFFICCCCFCVFSLEQPRTNGTAIKQKCFLLCCLSFVDLTVLRWFVFVPSNFFCDIDHPCNSNKNPTTHMYKTQNKKHQATTTAPAAGNGEKKKIGNSCDRHTQRKWRMKKKHKLVLSLQLKYKKANAKKRAFSRSLLLFACQNSR